MELGAPTSWSEARQFYAADIAENPREPLTRVSLRLFRVGQWLVRDTRPWAAPMRRLWWWTYQVWFIGLMGLELPPEIQACLGLRLRHGGRGTVVHPNGVLGSGVVVFHGVTLGTRNRGNDPVPRIGDGVELLTGCMVLGLVHVGAGARVGAGAVVIEDVPPGAIVVPPKSRILLRRPT